ncbi:MAG: hypothetical protein A2X93_08255 [Deltaproteobacteria bacterium GWC2_56_8]|nr:MAG: hypothetical protein A2X99_08560 [Deltaproteobacteria bacterium GWB2_55_19]OGP36616.1 MAG: hypothetical protein A2X93_08255 [Deltaproteobacteria bacterium GWC2_56_8]
MTETIETKMGLEGIKNCESKLRFTEERYKTIIRTSLDGFWIVDLTGRFIDVNDAYCSLIGYSRGELLKMRISDVEALETPEETARHIALVLEAGHARFETHHRRKDGRVLNIEVSANYTDAGGGFLFVFLRDITEIKKSSEKNTVLSGALDQSPSPVIITDTAGKIEYVNRRFTEAMGVSCEDAVGTTPCFLDHNESTKSYIDSLWETIRGGRTWRGDVCCVSRDGKTRWDLVTVSPIKDALGATSHFITVRIDDAERKRAEDALRESEERYRMLHSTAFDGMIIADSSGSITESNPSAEKMFGYGKGELIGREIIELMPQRFRAVHAAGFKKFLETGVSRSQGKVLELEGLKKDGATFPIELIIGNFTVNGSTLITATLRDITVRKQTEDALRKIQEDLAEAQKVAHIGSWSRDLIEDKVTWSDEMYRIFGLDRERFGARHESFIAAVHPDDRETVERAVRKCIEGSPNDHLEFRIVRPDKTVRTVVARCEVRRGDKGKPVTIFGTTQDITEQKALETETIKAQKLESLGVLAGGIAHNFNNLLTGILGNIFLAKGSVAGGDALKRLEEAERGIGMAKDLTSRLLTFSMGGSPVKHLASVSELVTESAGFVLSGSSVRPEYSIPDGLWAIEADTGLISQVIQNLVMNAAQAMPDGGVVKVSCDNAEVSGGDNPLKDGRYVKITVADNGVGIPHENMERIFDPYFTTKEYGTGLGLSASYSIIKNHDGHISVESTPGKGSAFFVYLPASRSTRPEALKTLSTVVCGSGRVLVMDDEEVVRDTAGAILGVLGYTAAYAKDGAEAIEAYMEARDNGEPFDAVIMDLTVPGGMGGKEAMEMLLQIDPSVKAIVSSGYSNDPIMSEFARSGFKAVIPKPYTVAEFSSTVNRVIKGG